MIFKDSNCYLVSETLDGMDSCFRAGIATVFKLDAIYNGPKNYCHYSPTPVRHPLEAPANNPKNFSRDQLIPLMGGLYTIDEILYSKRIFWQLFRRAFFCFNTERDMPGSTKYPWPHSFYKDSFPKSTTDHIFSTKKDYSVILPHELKGRKVEIESRLFDGPDPLLFTPHVIWYLAKCSRLRFIELLLAPIGYLWLYLSIYFHSKDPEYEINQILIITKIMGKFWVDLFKKYNPNWKEQVKYYFDSRKEGHYSYAIIENY